MTRRGSIFLLIAVVVGAHLLSLIARLLCKPIAWVRYALYIKYVVRHKYFVLVEGIRLQVPIIHLIFHDWTKFTPLEFVSYAHTYCAPDGTGQYKPTDDFLVAWNSHEKINKHHWQYWVLIMDSGELQPLPMPERHRREMLADWRGAGRALGKPDTAAWYKNNKEHIMLHEDTRSWVEIQLGLSS